MMTEDEIRAFVAEALEIAGDTVTVVERITERWMRDAEADAEEARDAIYDDARDSWNGGV